ncbi:MAG: hypothetical protein P8X74_20670 [Reinekea sp.]
MDDYRNLFSEDMYDLFFIDSAWLYEQRLGFFKKPDYLWTDFQSYETRLMHFLDALIHRDGTVDIYCRENAFNGDPGELFTAVTVLAKRHGLKAINPLINDIDFTDPAMKNAFIDAVSLALNSDDRGILIEQSFSEVTPAALEMAATLSGNHGLGNPDALLQSLKRMVQSENPAEYESAIQASLIALGKAMPLVTPAKQDFKFLYALIEQGHSDATLYCLSIAMLKARQDDIIRQGVAHMKQQAWPILPLAVYGKVGMKHFYDPLLTNEHSSPEQINDLLLALGLLGLPEDIPTLIQYLQQPDYAENAAMALQVMTGANLFEEVFVPEEIDPDTLYPEEREKYERGEPIYPEGDEPGDKVNRVCQQFEPWQKWHHEHKVQFIAGQRYRYGQVISAQVLLDALKADNTPHRIRAFIVDELAIQFNINLNIRTHMFVDDQMQAIEQTAKTIAKTIKPPTGY